MLRYVHPMDVTDAQLTQLFQSAKAADMCEFDVSWAVMSGKWKVFATGQQGIVAVSVLRGEEGGVLVIQALCAELVGQRFRPFWKAMRRLAADWECNSIETWAFDERHVRLLGLTGGKVKAWHVEIEV